LIKRGKGQLPFEKEGFECSLIRRVILVIGGIYLLKDEAKTTYLDLRLESRSIFLRE
jgi:hypothetical protein